MLSRSLIVLAFGALAAGCSNTSPSSAGPDADGLDAGSAPDAAGSPDSAPGVDSGSGCAANHPRIGLTAELATHSHGVRGTARIVDDCTVEIAMFEFDGRGVDVQVYGAAGGDYENGFALSEDLRREGGYVDATLIVTLPEGRSLDQLDGISIWCVPVGASFGDGLFAAP